MITSSRGAASEQILALVSGVPEPHRSNWRMLMLQAYVDDSASTKPPVFVLAGYLSSAERWASFSDEWKRVLDIHPVLNYFKMKEARARRGQFEGWSEERTNERLRLLYAVIAANVEAEFSIAFRVDEFRRTQTAYRSNARNNPYYFASAHMIEVARQFHTKAGVREPIDFIFDMQLMERRRVDAAWDWTTKNVPFDPPSLKTTLRNPPIFRDDKLLLPLQAADLCAWWKRRRYVENITGEAVLSYPWAPVPLTSLEITFTESQLREHNDRSIEMARRFPGAP